ncbi:MAG: M56 family metallopeptidase [Planctomycetes bacterium]|nr:M56 family metallopeptidase [Planctomycetota bacterium]
MGPLFAAWPADLTALWPTVLLDAVLKGLVLLAAALLGTRMLGRSSAAARHMICLLTIVGLLALPLLSAALPAWRVLPDWALPHRARAVPVRVAERAAPAAVATGEVRDGAATTVSGHGTAIPVSKPEPGTSAANEAPVGEGRSAAWWLTVVGAGAWALGVAVCLVPVVAGRICLRRLRWQSVAVVDGPWRVLLDRAASELGVRRSVLLLRSDRRAMPMVWGTLRPKLLLPAEAADWPHERLRAVLLHELAHVRRMDCLSKSVAHVAAAVHWFNPLVWLTFRRMQSEAERACDDLVLACGHRPADYAECVLEIASGLSTSLLAAQGGIAMARQSNLEGRLRAILDRGLNRRRLTRVGIVLAVLTVTVAVTSLSVLRARSDYDSAALRAVAKWAADHGWGAQDVEPTTLESRWLPGWRNLPFELSMAEEGDARLCINLARQVNYSYNGVTEFDKHEMREVLEAILAQRPDYFYAEYLLSVWYGRRGQSDRSRELIEQAYRHAPAVIVQRYELADGQPLADADIQAFELECNRVKRSSLNPSLKLAYFTLRTDADGCIYLPTYDTVWRRSAASHPAGFSCTFPRLGWFKSSRKVGLLPVAVVEPQAAGVGGPATARQLTVIGQELELGNSSLSTRFAIDFDTGQVHALPAEILAAQSFEKTVAWIQAVGIDALAEGNGNDRQLGCFDAAVVPLEDDQWDAPVDAIVQRAAAAGQQLQTTMKMPGDGRSATFAVRTREDGIALVRLMPPRDAAPDRLPVQIKVLRPGKVHELRFDDRTAVMGWNGKAVTIPGPPVFPEWIRQTTEFKLWQYAGDVRNMVTWDARGNRYVLQALGFVGNAKGQRQMFIPYIQIYRPDGSLLSKLTCGDDLLPLEWERYDAADGLRRRVTTRSYSENAEDRHLDDACEYEADGTQREWQINRDGVVRGELVTLPSGHIYYARYAWPFEKGGAFDEALAAEGRRKDAARVARDMLSAAAASHQDVVGRLLTPDSPIVARVADFCGELDGAKPEMSLSKATVTMDDGGGKATVVINVTYSDKQVKTRTVDLVNRDDYWLVSDVR